MLKQFTYQVEYTATTKLKLLAESMEEADERLQNELEWTTNPGSFQSFRVLDVKEEPRDEAPSHTY